MPDLGSALIHLVDDDPSVLRAVERLLRYSGHRCLLHVDARSFLARYDRSVPGCVLLDLELPDMDGFAVQSAIAGAHPVIFLTGNGDIAGSVRAIKSGAIDFLTKPCAAPELLAAVATALAADAARRMEAARRCDAVARLATLTPRERQVLDEVIQGRLNKQIAASIKTSEKTVKVHRFRLMRKLEARSVPDLIRIVFEAGHRPE
jgi:FixJ family two-component response regulator